MNSSAALTAAEAAGLMFYLIAEESGSPSIVFEGGKNFLPSEKNKISVEEYLQSVEEHCRKDVETFFSSALRSSDPFSGYVEFNTVDPLGNAVHIYTTLSNTGGNFSGVFTDITASYRKKFFNRVKAALVDSTVDFIGFADHTGKLIYLNDAAYRMMGYELDNKPHFETIADLHANNFEEFAMNVVQPAVQKNGHWTGQSFIKGSDGKPIEVIQSVMPIYDDNGGFFGTAAIVTDISEIVKLNQTIRENNDRFQQIMDSIRVGMVLIDMNTFTIETVNEWMCVLLKKTKEEIVGKHCYELLCQRSPELCPHMSQKDQKTIVVERIITRPDGTTVPVIKTGTWLDYDGKEYLMDTFVDISLQKSLESKILDAKNVAETANKAKSEFLSRMSHEMRTPLNAVIGMTQISKRITDIDKLRECLNTIETSSNHLLGLINDVLDLSKIESGKLELESEAFSFPAVLQKISDVIAPKINEKNITFLLSADETIPQSLVGDSMRLSQVMLNFLSNAVKFTDNGGTIKLRAKLLEKTDGEAKIKVSVSDTGIGMSEEHMSHLFKAFEQADGSISRRFGGTGLGLAISKRIIDLAGGEITVSSEPDKGSTFAFTITMPIAVQAAPVQADTMSVDDYNGIFAGKTLLVVDDVETNRLVVSEMLFDTGIAIIEAENGSFAISEFLDYNPDIILMDIQMPVMDGYEAVKNIRISGTPNAKDVPIIAMSANVFKDDMDKSLASGMNAHIGKPVDLIVLLRTLKKFLFNTGDALLHEEENAAEETAVKLKKDYKNIPVNLSIIDLKDAASRYSEDDLAAAIGAFLKDDRFSRSNSYMNSGEYKKAEACLSEYTQMCSDLYIGTLKSYVENVRVSLMENDYDFAKLYFNDARMYYDTTCAALRSLLQEESNMDVTNEIFGEKKF